MKKLTIILGLNLVLLASCSQSINTLQNWHKIASTDGKFTINMPVIPKSEIKFPIRHLKEFSNSVVYNGSLYQFNYLKFVHSVDAKSARNLVYKLAQGAPSGLQNGKLIFNKEITKGAAPCQEFFVKGEVTEKLKKDLAKDGLDLKNSKTIYWKGVNCLSGSYFAEADFTSIVQSKNDKEELKFFNSFITHP